ncbi:glycosyltransferase family 4 protein [Hymenobacter setariae]|uniref:Glycosyltransferase family 4 protein n=1 Tax=Hymenobacter setariae TaxID=2594794 RepID=A0A558BYE2_9BACT|nr:glycosyltransferase family 4 protein [Hymenobacter setariae]TVT41512.1 glycosyltransferase family 4 protein [Hymenobacter setariae]
MKIIFSHPTGNANVRAAANGLMKAGLLAEFHTSIASFAGSALDKLGGLGPLAEVRRRSFDSALQPVTKMWPWREVGRQVALKAGLAKLAEHEKGVFSVDAVYHDIDNRVAKRLKQPAAASVAAVYAYEDGAAAEFKAAKSLGVQCLYDLPIGYWRESQRLLATEETQWPEWAPTLTSLIDSEAKLARKDEELRLADCIFVASSFTAKTLAAFPGQLAPIKIIPYGFPPVAEARTYDVAKHRPLKVLFVGGLSQRKGIANLFAAADAIGPRMELTVVGRKASDNCPALDRELAKHRWIPSLPHQDILRLMSEQDVLVFPSLFEGFGLVITEAMSQGTPVITTERTAGPDLIEHGHNGWLVEAGSVSALQAAIEALLARPEAVAEAGRAAMQTARQRPWHVYGQELTEAISQHLVSKGK